MLGKDTRSLQLLLLFLTYIVYLKITYDGQYCAATSAEGHAAESVCPQHQLFSTEVQSCALVYQCLLYAIMQVLYAVFACWCGGVIIQTATVLQLLLCSGSYLHKQFD